MPDSVDFDFSQLNTLVADLGKVRASVIPNVRKAVEVSARNIKEDWRAAAKKANPNRARFYPNTIDYDMQLNTNGVIGAEIGPKLGGQGSLGFLEEAGGGVRSAPQRNVDKALRLNLSDFEKGIVKATEVIL